MSDEEQASTTRTGLSDDAAAVEAMLRLCELREQERLIREQRS